MHEERVRLAMEEEPAESPYVHCLLQARLEVGLNAPSANLTVIPEDPEEEEEHVEAASSR